MRTKTLVACLGLTAALCGGRALAMGYGDYGASVGLISSEDLAHTFEVGALFAPEADIKGAGDTSMMEADSDWALAHFKDVVRSDVDMGLVVNTLVFGDDAGIGLPGAVVEAALRIGALWKGNEAAVELRLSPGLYTDFDGLSGRDFACPVGGVASYRFHPEFAGMAGLEVRPGFDRNVMPLLAVAWNPSDYVRLYVGIPRTRLLFRYPDVFSFYLDAEWRSVTYDMTESGDNEREALTVDDTRFGMGFVWQATDNLQLGLEGGVLRWRSLEFERGRRPDEEHEMDGSSYFRASVGMPF